MDEAQLERLHSALAALGLPSHVIEHHLNLAVADAARPTTDSDRMIVNAQRKGIYLND